MALNGDKRVLGALKRNLARISHKTDIGMREASNFIKAESQKRTPVATGFLRNSHRVSRPLDGFSLNLPRRSITVSVLAHYAEIVHDNVHIKRNNGQPLFLLSAVRENTRQIFDIIRRHAKF